MGAIAKGDISVASGGNIRHVTGSNNHTVLELHRFLMGLQDDTSASDDDYLDVTNEIISSTRKTDQIVVLNAPYNIDQALSERFFGGSIEQNDGDDLYSGLITYGSFNSGTTQISVMQNGALLSNHWGTGKNINATLNILNRILVKSRSGGTDIDGKRIISTAREWGDTFAEFSTLLAEGEAVASLATLPDAFNTTGSKATIDAMSGDFTYTTGFQQLDVDVDGTDEDYLGKWDISGSGTKAYLYEYVKSVSVRGESGTGIFGFAGELYRGCTHEIDFTGQTTNFTELELLTFGNGATGRLLAMDDGGATGTIWIQLMTGVAPGNTDSIAGSSGDGAVDGAPTSRTIASTAIGSYTGNFTTAYGVGIVPTDITKDDTVTNLLNTTKNPPNYVDITINSLVNTDIVFAHRTKTNAYTVDGSTYDIGDTDITMTGSFDADEPQVGKIVIDGNEYAFSSWTGAIITLAGSGLTAGLTGGETVSLTSWDKNMYTLSGLHNSGTDLTVTVSIVKDIPPAGYLRVWNAANSSFDRLEYTSFTGAVFTLAGAITGSYADTADVFIGFIDEQVTSDSITKQIVYTADIASKLRMYNATLEIVPFEVPFTVGSGGSTTPAIRNSDA